MINKTKKKKLRLIYKDLKSHKKYRFKNKQIYRNEQKNFAEKLFEKLVIVILGVCIIIDSHPKFLPKYEFLPTKQTLNVSLIFILVLILGAFGIWSIIEFPFAFYLIGVPLYALIITSLLEDRFKSQNILLLAYILSCLIIYILLAIFLPINLLRKITPTLAFVPTFVSIIAQLVLQYKNVWLNYITKGAEEKIKNNFFNISLCHINSIKKIVRVISKLYDYLYVENQANAFYVQLSLFVTGMTITYLIGGIFITIRTHRLDLKAERLWKQIIFSKTCDYDQLIYCAYVGGSKYERVILSNPDFRKEILNAEKDIDIEKGWKDKARDDIKIIYNEYKTGWRNKKQ